MAEATSSDTVTFMGVGDVVVNRPDPDSMFAKVRSLLGKADILFGNCEVSYSERGSPNPINKTSKGAHPRNVAGLKGAGFKVMQYCNNVCLSWGYEAFLDNIAVLKENGIQAVGAGANLAEVRKPVIITCRGTRVAFLAYAPVSFLGYEAGEEKPGIAPFRVHTHYFQIESEQPGSNPVIQTYTDEKHLRMMTEDIQRARAEADVVVVGYHWGIHHRPKVMPMYELEVGHAAIDAGADLILGGSQHFPHAVEVYKGKVIFHGLGDFGVDVSNNSASGKRKTFMDEPAVQALYPGYALDRGVRRRTHPWVCWTLIVEVVIRGRVIERVGFHPALNARAGIAQGDEAESVELWRPGDQGFRDVLDLVEASNREVGFDTRFSVEDDQVVIALRA